MCMSVLFVLAISLISILDRNRKSLSIDMSFLSFVFYRLLYPPALIVARLNPHINIRVCVPESRKR